MKELASPGSVLNDEHLGPAPMRQAEAIIRGIHADSYGLGLPPRIDDPSRPHHPRRGGIAAVAELLGASRAAVLLWFS